MKKISKTTTKKLCVSIISAAMAVGMLSGCGKGEAVDGSEPATNQVSETTEAGDTVVEATTEEGSVATPFLEDLEKYDSIISTLTTNQYYAFAAIAEDYDVLLVTDGVYDNLDGNMATIDATVYGIDSEGEVCYAGSVWSDGTAYPLAIYEDSLICGGNHRMTRVNVRDGAVITIREADEVFDEQGNATYSYNDGDIDNIIEVEDDSILAEMYAMYADATVINFFPGEAEGEVVGDEEIGDYPSNSLEDRVGKTSFSSYDEIIGLLEEGEAYAYVEIKGYDGKVLLVTESTYEGQDGQLLTTECVPYTMKSNGKCTADSLIYSGGTANPIAIDKDGVIYTATHTTIDKSCYGENGTDDVAIMVLAYVSADEFDDNGDPKTVSGFTRTKNSVIDDDSVYLNGDEVELFNQLFEEYAKVAPVSFTKAGK